MPGSGGSRSPDAQAAASTTRGSPSASSGRQRGRRRRRAGRRTARPPGPARRGRRRRARRPGRRRVRPPARASAPRAVARTAGAGSARNPSGRGHVAEVAGDGGFAPPCELVGYLARHRGLTGETAIDDGGRSTTADETARPVPGRTRPRPRAATCSTPRARCSRSGATRPPRSGSITDRANTAHGTFYLYFRNKEDAFCQVIESVIVDELAVRRSCRSTMPPGGRSRRAMRAFLGVYEQARGPVAGAARGHAAVAQGAAAVARPARGTWSPACRTTFAAQQRAGQVREFDTMMVAHCLAAMTEWSAFTHLVLRRADARPAARPRRARRRPCPTSGTGRSTARSTADRPAAGRQGPGDGGCPATARLTADRPGRRPGPPCHDRRRTRCPAGRP